MQTDCKKKKKKIIPAAPLFQELVSSALLPVQANRKPRKPHVDDTAFKPGLLLRVHVSNIFMSLHLIAD